MKINRKVTVETRIRECDSCGKDTKNEKFTTLVSGDAMSHILLVRDCPNDDEVARNCLWSDQAGHRFAQMMNEYWLPINDIATTFLMRCPLHKFGVKHVRNCDRFLQKAMQDRTVVICMGRTVMKHLCMQGAPPPSLDTIAGRFVKMREFGNTRFTVLPEQYSLVLGSPEEREADVIARINLMRTAITRLAKEIDK